MFWKSSSTGAIFPQKVASLRFQTLQQKGRKIQVFRCVLKNWLQIIATVGLEKPTYFKFIILGTNWEALVLQTHPTLAKKLLQDLQ